MKQITDNKGNIYPVIEIFNDEWAVVSKSTVGTATVMNAIHLTKKTKGQITCTRRNVLINENVNFSFLKSLLRQNAAEN